MTNSSESMQNRDIYRYLELLLHFDNVNHSGKILKKLMNISISDERIEVMNNIKKGLKKKSTDTKLFAMLIIMENNKKYPLLLPIEIRYNANKLIIMNRGMELIIRKAASIVENHFAQKHINIDINPYSVFLKYYDLLNHYELNCNSIELPLAVYMYGMITGLKPKKKYALSGGLDYSGNIIDIDNINDKIYAAKKENSNLILILPQTSNTNMKCIKKSNFENVIKEVYGNKKYVLKREFIGNNERTFNIAEQYLLRGDSITYLPMYKNVEILTKNSKQAKERNIYFMTLMRQAMHYNQAGNIEEAEKYFNLALIEKKALKKEDIFELNKISSEFNNIYAVFLKDIYKKKQGMKLLMENLREKGSLGKHIIMTTNGTIAQYLIDDKKYEEAERILLENLEIAKMYVKEDISRTHCYLARLYTIKGDTKKALSNIEAAEKNVCSTNAGIQSIFILYEKIRLDALKEDSKKCEIRMKQMKKLVKSTHFNYMYYLALEEYANSYRNTNPKKQMKILITMFEYVIKGNKKIFYPFCLRGFAENYLITGNKKNVEYIRYLGKNSKLIKHIALIDKKNLRKIIKEINIV